MNKKPWNKKGS